MQRRQDATSAAHAPGFDANLIAEVRVCGLDRPPAPWLTVGLCLDVEGVALAGLVENPHGEVRRVHAVADLTVVSCLV
jgi:hypothetical protein